jgi:DNA gyrase subunit B
MNPQNPHNSNVYDHNQIKYLEPREHIRLRPGMYIGGTDKRALHHMVWEVLDNSIEEAMLDKCTRIQITILANRTICIEDDSGGLPVDVPTDSEGRSIAELIMTRIVPKSSFQGRYYGVYGGIHGVGLSIVNTLSTLCKLEIKRDGFLWQQTYIEGFPSSALAQIRPLEISESTGTSITFTPDFTILDENEFDFVEIAFRCRELAFLLPNLEFSIQDMRESKQLRYQYPNGLLDWLKIQTENETAVHMPLFIQIQTEMQSKVLGQYIVGLDLAIQYVEASFTIERSFINSVPISAGGSHLEGLRHGLQNSLSTDTLILSELDVMHGLIVAINLRHPDPQFGSPTKITLMNTDVQVLIEQAIEALFAAHPEAKEAIRAHFKQA